MPPMSLAFMRHERVKVDTVFLFGFLYHVPYHVELLQELWRTGALTIIVDSAVSPEQGSGEHFANTLSLIAERVDDISNAAYEIFPGAGTAIVGLPSRAAITFLLQAFQFSRVWLRFPGRRSGAVGEHRIGRLPSGTAGDLPRAQTQRARIVARVSASARSNATPRSCNAIRPHGQIKAGGSTWLR